MDQEEKQRLSDTAAKLLPEQNFGGAIMYEMRRERVGWGGKLMLSKPDQAATIRIAVLCILLGWAHLASSAEDSPRIFAIGRYALETNAFHDLYDHVESVEPSGINYDKEFQHPHLPPGPLLIDCQLTHRIGATLAIDIPPERPFRYRPGLRSDDSWFKTIKVRYEWSHSNAKGLGRSYYVTPSAFSSGNVLSGGFTLTRKTRVEGVWILSVTYNGEEIYRTGFQLFRCKSNEP